MHKTIITLLFGVLSVATAHAQTHARELWLAMPDTLQPYDDLDVSVDTATADYMSVHMSNALRMELRLLPRQQQATCPVDTLLCVVRTYEAINGESDIRFYTTAWQRLAGTFGLPEPVDGDRLLSELTYCPDTMTREHYDELCRYIDPIMFTASLAPDTPTLTLTLSTPMLRRDEEEAVRAILRQRRFKWDGTIFN